MVGDLGVSHCYSFVMRKVGVTHWKEMPQSLVIFSTKRLK